MSNTIWKTVLSNANTVSQEIEVPKGAEILCACEQHETLCIWYLCDPTAEKEIRKIIVYGTGDNIPHPDKIRYLGTGSLLGAKCILHIFEQT